MKREAIGLQVTLDVEERNAVVVGGDAEAEDKVARLLDGGALVTVIAREPSMALAALAASGRIQLFPRDFQAGDLNDADLVFTCVRDPTVARTTYDAAMAKGVAAW